MELESAKGDLSPRGEVVTAVGDISRQDDIGRVAAEVKKIWGKVDILINAAATSGPIGPVTDVGPRTVAPGTRYDLFGTFLSMPISGRFTKEAGSGAIINFSGGGEGVAVPLLADPLRPGPGGPRRNQRHRHLPHRRRRSRGQGDRVYHATGVSQSTATTAAGLYSFVSLNPGSYRVTASLRALKRSGCRPGRVDQVTAVLALQVGGVTRKLRCGAARRSLTPTTRRWAS